MQFQLKLVFLFIAVIAVDSRRSNREPEGCKKLFNFLGDLHRGCSWNGVSYMPKRILMQTDSTCASFAVTYALEFLFSKEQNRPIQGSSQWICDTFNTTKIRDILSGAFGSYCESEQDYPYTSDDIVPPENRYCRALTELPYTYVAYRPRALPLSSMADLVEQQPIIAGELLI
ncbi:hypothetical protein M3Y95_00765800 [Aphelenchoides besseyi]|nr:hypothetical protein M3Y95_00765800 [Aphelenchoides besseyi]